MSQPQDQQAPQQLQKPERRAALVYAAAAVAAGLAGVGAARWRSGHSPASFPKGAAGTPAAAFWSLTLDSPDGAPMAMQQFAGKPLLLNFWATWCPPCVEELPLLSQFQDAHRSRGWQVLGLAVDQPSAVRNWLARSPLTFPVAMAGLGGTDLSKQLGNLTGGLPFSVVLGADGALLHRKAGQLTPEDLAQWAQLA
jgi:thiol-disulfide isomerase/thioredoxin